jgi:Peptidase family M23
MSAMSARLRILFCFLLASGSIVASPPAAAAATGPYTLPFFSSHPMTQDYGPSSCTCESPGHGYLHWHPGIDWGMPIGTDIAASNSGTIASYKEDLYDGAGPDQYGQGNFVFVAHGSNRWTLYYHLTHNGVLGSTGAGVSAGQQIADSGNTGHSTGPHLHYALVTSAGCQSNGCDTDPRLWTTSPGRVPWRAAFYDESNHSVVHVVSGTTITFWVMFRNTGGRTWSSANDALGHGRLELYSTASGGTSVKASPFQAADWVSSSLPTRLEEATVAPDAVGSFRFGIRGSPPLGSYPHNAFNLRASTLAWFDYAALGYYEIAIEVDPDCHIAC